MKTVSKTYFGCTVTAMNKGPAPYIWMFQVEKCGRVWEFLGVPNYCDSLRSALRRAWWRAKWLADGTYDDHYK